jgi:hypothetical protein
MRIEGLHYHGPLPLPQLLLCLVIPGLSLLLLGRRTLGLAFVAVYFAGAAAFVAGLGFVAGDIGYGIVISIHATSICFLEAHWLKDSSFNTRLALAFCTLVAVWGLIYAPLVHLVESRWIVPMRFGNHVMIVQRGVNVRSLKRGDWVAFKLASNRFGDHEDRVVVDGGMVLDRVVALPGDHVEFATNAVIVNGVAVPAQRLMPENGELVLPENVWFIWPNLDIYRHGAAAFNITATLQDAAMVKEKQIVGRAFKSWCGRSQLP